MTKKEARDPNYCSKHPEYKGIKRPKTNCFRCNDKFNRLNGVGATTPADIGKRKVNRIAFVVDRSGSMQGLTRRSVRALNENLAALKKKAAETGQQTIVTVLNFDDRIEVLRENFNVRDLPEFREHEFTPRNSTALFDATAKAIDGLETYRPEDLDRDVSFLVVVITDGLENASRNHAAGSLRRVIQRVQATDRWTLTFLVPPGHKEGLVRMLGVPDGNVAEWEQTERGVQRYEQSVTQGIGSYYDARILGATSSQTFFTTDLSSLKIGDLRRSLVDVSGEVSVWTVDRETDVRSFCEKKSRRPLLKGAAFYALTKDEEVQAHKKLLVAEKGKPAVYAGDDARRLLGFPVGVPVEVRPGNHANFDVFVQSTSTNRKLVRGTRVIYYPGVGTPYAEGRSAPEARAKMK